jgi:hypothetical protein
MVYSVGMLSGRLSRRLKPLVVASLSALLLVASGQAVSAVPPVASTQGPQKADSILILKKDHMMELMAGGKVIRTFKVALGQGGLAPKQREAMHARPKATT